MWCSALLILPLNESTVHLLLKTLPMADGTSFCCVELVRLTCPLPVVFCRILKATFDFSVWCSVQQLSILSRYLVMMKSIICQCLERGCIQVVLHSSFCLIGVRHYQFERRAQSQYKLAIGDAFPNPMFAHDQGPLVIASFYPRIAVSYQL